MVCAIPGCAAGQCTLIVLGKHLKSLKSSMFSGLPEELTEAGLIIVNLIVFIPVLGKRTVFDDEWSDIDFS